MRVLHVLPSIAPSYGGPSAALIGLSQALSVRNVYSETVTTDLGYEATPDLVYGRLVEFKGINVRYFPRRLSSFFPRDFALAPRLSKWLKNHIRDYDIVNVHGLFSYPNTAAARIAFSAGVPYVIRPCGMLDPWSMNQSAGKKKAYLRIFDQKLLRQAAAISFTTEEEARMAYMAGDRSNGVVIPLGVNLAEHVLLEPADFPFTTDKKIILFLSRLDPKKGLDLLLPSLARLMEVRDDFICLIAGSGDADYETLIRTKVESHRLGEIVRFTSFVDGNLKNQLFRRACCFVLPSYQENFGVSVVEAMAAGCPVIVSDQVNIHQQVSKSQAGRVVRCDVDALFQALNELLSNRELCQRMGLNGQKLVREKYNWDHISKKVISLYQHCIDKNRPNVIRQLG